MKIIANTSPQTAAADQGAQPAQEAVVSTASAVLPVTPGPIHPAWYARAGTWLLGIGKAIKNAVLKVAGDEPAISAEIAKIAPTAEAISNLFLPGSGNFEQHLLDVWGVVASAAKGAGDAASANGISVTFDAALIADVKAILPTVEQFLHPSAGPTAPTA